MNEKTFEATRRIQLVILETAAKMQKALIEENCTVQVAYNAGWTAHSIDGYGFELIDCEIRKLNVDMNWDAKTIFELHKFYGQLVKTPTDVNQAFTDMIEGIVGRTHSIYFPDDLACFQSDTNDFEILYFEAKEVVDEDHLSRVASVGYVHFRYVDTGESTYAIVASILPMTEEEAQAAYDSIKDN